MFKVLSVNQLSQLVSDLLLLTRLDRQVQRTSLKICDLEDLISDIEEELAALVIAENITLTTDISGDQALAVEGEEKQLYRLIFNIIVNAIQYTPAGGLVHIGLNANDGKAEIRVKDTGIGIAPQHQSKIFDRFYRVDSDRSRRTGGSGLGLSIAQAIAQAHHGSIQIQSEPSNGSQFTIWLPLKS